VTRSDRQPVQTEVSAGGVTYRLVAGGGVEIALISVASPPRWQLPKGHVDPGESPEQAAMREVREETGIETTLVAPLEVIDYWYHGLARGRRVRVHKYVHFYLLAHRAGDVRDHDHEVHEARWMPLDEALRALAFDAERSVLERARGLIESGEDAHDAT